MISNERVQALIALDRETLIDLLAAAMAAGSWGGSSWNVYQDIDIRSLLEAAKARNARPATLTPADGWMLRGGKL